MLACMGSKGDGEKTDDDAVLWLNEYGDYLYRYALFRISNHEVARDMVQETLIGAWKARANFRGDSTRQTWLIGIMKNKIIDHIRKEIRSRHLSDALENDPTSSFFDSTGHWTQPVHGWEDDPERLVRNQDFHKVLHHCLSALPERHRHIFTLREIKGEDTESVCNSCNITSSNLHVIMHRARLALRSCLEKNWFGNKDEDTR